MRVSASWRSGPRPGNPPAVAPESFPWATRSGGQPGQTEGVGAGLVTSFVSYFLGQAILSAQHINSTLGEPGVLRAVVGGGLFLAVCGMLSFGLGVLLRHTAGAITGARCGLAGPGGDGGRIIPRSADSAGTRT
jgi:hypothetical protein